MFALNKQTKIYSSNYYLQPLILGDIWLAVGWSNEIIPLLSRRRDLKAIVPQSGTALWADVWVKPTSDVKLSNLAQEWINFCWQPTAVQQISLYTDAVSPLILDQNSEKLPKPILNNPLLFIEPTILNKSEFIKPLPPSSQAQYEQLWKEARTMDN